ncbi:MAG: glycoside hydrolase family 78 protein [Treponema sp.]|jgi:alpha-L-rhamnosidase|nr:glycoside hydrolase family 78 protein [Treponema sp.]
MNEFIPDAHEGVRSVLSCSGAGFPGMLAEAPFFSWKTCGLEGRQSEYRLIVSSSREAVSRGTGDVWDSLWVQSPDDTGIPYGGSALESNRDYYAAVGVRSDVERRISLSEPVPFSTGFLDPSEWKAPWLCAPVASDVNPMFRRDFSLTGAPARARLFICGLGYYEAYINGTKAGDRMLAPSWTDYGKRVCYVAHDVTALLKKDNAIGVMLGSGWYSNAYCTPRPVFTAQLLLEYEDGSAETILSAAHNGWYANNDGPMRKASIYIGELYDARLEKPGWAEYGFDMKAPSSGVWKPAIETEPPAGKMAPMTEEPIRAIGEIEPVSISEINGTAIIDFGQNIAGVLRLAMHAPRDTRVRIRYSELLWKDGSLNTGNLRTAQETDEYICRGGGEEYMPRFTYHGFRYAGISGISGLKKEDVRAVVLRNDVAVRGRFRCSNDLLNSIQRICVWTESNNLHGVPTDCPQRDERLGWLNDLTVRAEEAVYNFDMSRFYRKFLMDIADGQGPRTGAITDTAPYRNFGGQPADAVCSSYLVLPWLLYMHHGDREALRRHYGGLAAWTRYLESQCEDGIVNYSYYGDWAAPIAGNDAESYGSGAVSVITPGLLMSTGFLYMNAALMKKIAGVLGKADDVKRYEDLAASTKDALNRTFLNREKGYYGTGSQAANVFMLYLGIVPEELRSAVMQNLVKDIRDHGTHLTTGNLCSRYIFDVLADGGQIDLAFELASQKTYPSWGYMLANGATSTWERWEYVDSGPLLGMASHDHPMYATISGWFYSYLLGIRPLEAGFKTFAFKPYIPKALQSAEGAVKTTRGDIEASWTQEGGRVTMKIAVPFNSLCCAMLPADGKVAVNGVTRETQKQNGEAFIMLESGRYEITELFNN